MLRTSEEVRRLLLRAEAGASEGPLELIELTYLVADACESSRRLGLPVAASLLQLALREVIRQLKAESDFDGQRSG